MTPTCLLIAAIIVLVAAMIAMAGRNIWREFDARDEE